MDSTKDKIAQRLLENSLGYLRQWFPTGTIRGDEYVFAVRHDDKNPSFSVNMKTGAFQDFGDPSAKGKNLFDLWLNHVAPNKDFKDGLAHWSRIFNLPLSAATDKRDMAKESRSIEDATKYVYTCLLYTSPSPRDS